MTLQVQYIIHMCAHKYIITSLPIRKNGVGTNNRYIGIHHGISNLMTTSTADIECHSNEKFLTRKITNITYAIGVYYDIMLCAVYYRVI